jgi:hypothetical protein
MTVSGWHRAFNHACVAITLLTGATLSACASPNLSPATFPLRSDTTEPGTLLGPYDGRVTDAGSQRPVPGALVWVSYAFCRGELLCTPAGSHTWTGETDADGRYAVPELDRFPGSVRLDRVTLVIYKRGYIGYRSDRYFENALPRRDFAQHRNDVKLERFAEGFSHAEHLSFIGGSGALRAALRAEALQVSVDASGAGPSVPFDASALLSVEELRQATGSTDDFGTERLSDRPRTPRYDSLHFKSVTRGEEGDAALRVFLFGNDAEAEKNFEEFAPSLPNAKAVDPVPDGLGQRLALAKDGEGDHAIYGLIALDRPQRAVLLVTCGASLCDDPTDIQAIAQKALARLPRTGRGPLPENAPGTKVAPAKEKEQEPTFKLREPELKK